MDRELPQEAIRRRNIKRIFQILALIAIVTVAMIAFRSCLTPSVSRNRILTSVVERGSIDASLSAGGIVEPEYEQVMTSPVRSTVLEVLLHSGDTVKAGEPILRLDTEAAESRAEKLQDEVLFFRNQKEQLKLELESRTIDLDASRDIKELEVKFAESELERIQHLLKIGGSTGAALSQAELNLDIARRQYAQLTQSIDNQKSALEIEIEGLDLQIKMKTSEALDAERDLENAQIRAERSGVVTWVNDDVGASVAPGDAVARVANLESYKVEAQISDIHSARLKIGGPVVIQFGKSRLEGSIGSVHPSVENGIARFEVHLDDESHPALRPNLRVDVFVITSYKDNVIRVENGPFYKGRVDQKIFVIDGERAVRRIVDIGVSNYDYVELMGDVSPGDEVIISDMSKYEHAEEIDVSD